MVRTGLLMWLLSSAPVSVLIGRVIAGPPGPDLCPRLPVLVSASSG